MQFTCPFILASASPRRRDLLSRLGVPFDVIPARIDERLDGDEPPSVHVERLALEKARVVADGHPDALVLGADTIVVLDGRILGKPTGPDDATEMLRQLAGRTHQVFSGVALVHRQSRRMVTSHRVTRVTFARLTDDEIRDYVASGTPLDKAGSYGIQDDRGALFVDGIDGDYYTVVGLPLRMLYHLVRTEFTDLLST